MRFLATALAAALLAAPAFAEDGPDATTEGFFKRTTELRGLEFKSKPKVRYWKVEELRKMMKDDFDTEFPEEKARDTQEVLFAFGLTPKGYELRQEYLDLMLEQIAGFYHPKKKILCLIEGKSGKGMEEETVIIHELNHALQDQYYDLTRLQDLVAKNDDMGAAFKCLVEGEATMVMFDHVLQAQGGAGMTSDQVPGIEGIIENQMKASGGMAGQEKLGKAPLMIREGLISSYIDGFKFCVAIKRHGGWDELNKVWADIPVSTEQALHPDRYIERDMPQTVTIPEKLDGLDGWEAVETNVMGEFGMRMVFQTLKPKSPESGIKAAEGWDGDTYRLYRKGEGRLLVWATVWDTEVDAREFATAYVKAIRKKHEGLGDAKADGNVFSHESADGWVIVSRDGRKVFTVEGGSEDEANAALKGMTGGAKFDEMKPGFGAPEEKKK
ncbi:MAG: hypothetical protein K8T20_02035 [Planctomycetes bacterium]|nr:hypothetical protein [Planctomycetota bacterium]